MANHNNSNATPDAILGKTPAVCHEYDDGLLDKARDDANAVFASTVVDIARGACVIAKIMSAHVLDLNAIARGADDPVLLNENDMEALGRLAVHSLNELYQLACDRTNTLNILIGKGAKA